MYDKKVLITGGAGFIGSHLAEKLSRSNKVIVLDDLSTGKVNNVPNDAIFIKGSILDTDIVRYAVEQADVVFHLAAHISTINSVENPEKDMLVNTMGTLNIIGACRRGNKKLIYTSSAAVYGNPPKPIPVSEKHPARPDSPYGVSKLAAEHYVRLAWQLHKLPASSVRFFNVYGPRQSEKYGYTSVISVCLRAALGSKNIDVFGDGEQTRDFVYVGDAVNALIEAADADNRVTAGKVFNVATGRSSSVNDVIAIVEKVAGVKLTVNYRQPRPGEVRYSVASVESIGHALGFAAVTSLKEGIEQTYRYMKGTTA